MKGNYKIEKENIDFTFELGPKGGRTKGKFKALVGDVKVAEQIENSEFDVKLNVLDLTTMNKFRDESLMGAEYFNVAKFPLITFKSKKLVAKNDLYELTGEFTMLGVKKSQIVNVKLVSGTGEGVKPVLIGKGSIDRTMFGMKPDPKEGNVVDFRFTIQLDKLD
jgi:polyisoprenoid-binding protein YceI